jgi:hypothetical protein
VKPDQPMTNHDRDGRKSQGVASAAPAVPPARKEGGDRKGEEKKKIKPSKLAQSAGQGR